MIGGLTGKSTDQRLAGSLAGALAGVQLGAAIVRVHDVPETIDALKVMRNLI
jgi:dihydropteroate synthase